MKIRRRMTRKIFSAITMITKKSKRMRKRIMKSTQTAKLVVAMVMMTTNLQKRKKTSMIQATK